MTITNKISLSFKTFTQDKLMLHEVLDTSVSTYQSILKINSLQVQHDVKLPEAWFSLKKTAAIRNIIKLYITL